MSTLSWWDLIRSSHLLLICCTNPLKYWRIGWYWYARPCDLQIININTMLWSRNSPFGGAARMYYMYGLK